MSLLDDPHHLYLRHVASNLTPNATQRSTIIVAGCYVIAIAILWHVPYINEIMYPFKLITIGFHEMSHVFAGMLTCATIHSVRLDPDEGGETRMSGGLPRIILPAGYLGSSFIGACFIACGFDTNASKVACLVLAVFFVFTLWWARRNWLTWVLILGMSALIIAFWFIEGGAALRYLILFVGVMSDLYVVWDVVDEMLEPKNESDVSTFAVMCGCFTTPVWGFIWLIIAIIFFAAGVLVGIAAFKESAAEQRQQAAHFLPVPGSTGGTIAGLPVPTCLVVAGVSLVWNLLA